MAQIKLAEYTFDNTVADVLPSLTPNTITITNSDTVDDNITTRIIYIDGATMPTAINFNNALALLTVDYLNIETNVTKMKSMFGNCSKLTSLDVSNWNTSSVTNMNSMFYNCTSLTSLNLSSFNTSKVTDMYCMFHNCKSLT